MTPSKTSTHNHAFLALFTLPPIKESSSTELTVPATPAPTVVTGDRELDAVLWLRECIGTAHSALIEKALEAFKKIKTPAKDLEKRYGDYLMRVSGGCAFSAALGSISFANLEALARRVTERQARKHEAMSRFGSVEALFENTPSEAACRVALKGLRKKKDALWGYEAEKADARFMNRPELVPASLSDCLVALDYEKRLYWLRCASVENAGDHWPEFQEHADFCFRQLALIAPASKDEALAVFEHLVQNDEMGRTGTPDIMRNLIAGGKSSTDQKATLQPDDAKLWCVHITGADDVHAMPSHGEALHEANALNAVLVRNSHEEGDPIMIAVATEWPHSAESHAAGVAIRAEAMRLRRVSAAEEQTPSLACNSEKNEAQHDAA